MASCHSTFKYEPLDHSGKSMRLLEVLHEGNGNVIRCKLRTYTVDEAPPYAALSYTWDRDGRSELIECNGMTMKVGGNVWDLLSLYRFRAKDAKRGGLIWIDAVCINQKDVKERNHQVNQMRDIYSGAELVVVWLGQVQDEVELVFHLARVLERPLTMNGDDIRWYTSLQQWKAITRILQRPYWTRVWIAQEFILAKSIELWCGAYSVGGLGFDHLARWIHDMSDDEIPEQIKSSGLLKSPGWKLLRHRTIWWQIDWTEAKPSAFELHNLLPNFADLQSSDPRDKLYGLLGLVHDTTQEDSIEIDYSKCVSEIAVKLIRTLYRSLIKSDRCEEAHRFALAIIEAWNITDIELITHTLIYEPNLQFLLCSLVSTACVVVPLQHVSTVTFAGWMPPCTLACQQRYRKEPKLERYIPLNKLEFRERAPDLASELSYVDTSDWSGLPMVDRWRIFDKDSVYSTWDGPMRDDDGTPLGRLQVREVSSCWADDVKERHRPEPPIEKKSRPLPLGHSGDKIEEHGTEEDDMGRTITSFVGTNGLLGTTCDVIEPLDALFVISGSPEIKQALIARPFPLTRGDVETWHIVGTAVLFREDQIRSRGNLCPPPKHGPANSLKEEVKSHCLSRKFDGLELGVHPALLEDLVRCRLLHKTDVTFSRECECKNPS
jgi:hypothetical protein